ncbi:hypothetical protein L9F63_006922, partial [Diploptera punctata]
HSVAMTTHFLVFLINLLGCVIRTSPVHTAPITSYMFLVIALFFVRIATKRVAGVFKWLAPLVFLLSNILYGGSNRGQFGF